MKKNSFLYERKFMPSNSLHMAIVLSLAYLLNACVSYNYIPPITDAGRQCVATCEVASQTCEAGMRQANALRDNMYQTRNTNKIALCLAGAKNDQERKLCQRNQDWGSSYNSGAYNFNYSNNLSEGGHGSCGTSYNRCFVSCGGKIIEVPN